MFALNYLVFDQTNPSTFIWAECAKVWALYHQSQNHFDMTWPSILLLFCQKGQKPQFFLKVYKFFNRLAYYIINAPVRPCLHAFRYGADWDLPVLVSVLSQVRPFMLFKCQAGLRFQSTSNLDPVNITVPKFQSSLKISCKRRVDWNPSKW